MSAKDESIQAASATKAQPAAPNTNIGAKEAPNDALIGILARSLERQVAAAERSADRMDDLGVKIDAMATHIALTMQNGLTSQFRFAGAVAALAFILLAAIAGVQFGGQLRRDEIQVNTKPPMERR